MKEDMHLDDQILNSYIDNELSEPWKTQVEEHLDWCKACRARFNEINKLHGDIQNAGLSDEDIKTRQNRVLKYIDKNTINKKKFSFRGFFHKIPKFILYPAFTACLTFCFCLIIFNSPEKKKELLPSIDAPTNLSIDNITQIRTTDNYTTSETLNKYSLEEILQYLDSKGYDVDLKMKPISTLPEEGIFLNTEDIKTPRIQFLRNPALSVFSVETSNLFSFKPLQYKNL